MYNLQFELLENEAWYGFCADAGVKFPLTKKSVYQLNLDPNPTNNQSAPFMVSSKGRYVYSENGFELKAEKGFISISSTKSEVILQGGYENLKNAYLAAAKTHFCANGVAVPKDFFVKPQYNTWIELIYKQNQADVLKYANDILKNDLPAGILMIDDSWSDYYGRWDFNRRTFPEPKQMVQKLHQMGFKVMLWVCPFISPDSVEMKELKKQGLLVRNSDGTVAVREWWNGFSAELDLTNPKAALWMKAQLDYLMQEYEIDGFKFDAGDGIYYKDDDITFLPTDANGQCRLWAEFGANYEYNEYRACFKCQDLPIVQRLADKFHAWEFNGIASLVPNQLAQGILGYAFTCPDMIGGGEYESFTQNSAKLDQELFVRYAQCAALMPMMQFSAAPWRVLSAENAQYCKDAAKLHIEFGEEIYELAKQAANTNEPIVRYMEYEFPSEGFEEITNQFMLGSEVLVAPVTQKGKESREVKFPKGKWKSPLGVCYSEGVQEVPARLSTLLYFRRVR